MIRASGINAWIVVMYRLCNRKRCYQPSLWYLTLKVVQFQQTPASLREDDLTTNADFGRVRTGTNDLHGR